jgi:hypothetical protein
LRMNPRLETALHVAIVTIVLILAASYAAFG